MANFLATLLRLSFWGSMLAVLLILPRYFLRRWVHRAAFYYLWLLVLLRLCVPLGITVPLPSGFDLPHPSAALSQPNSPASPALAESGALGAAPSLPQATPAQAPATPGATGLAGALNWSALLTALWGLGALMHLGWYIWSYLHFFRRVKSRFRSPSPQALAVLRELSPVNPPDLAECPLVNTPMQLGVIHPVILLPVGTEGRERLKDILSHELTHARRHDLLYKWFAVVATSLHWFNPMMLLVRREIRTACELSCDEAVIRGLDEEGRRHYGQTLLDMAATPTTKFNLLTITLCEEKEQLKERLVSIVQYHKKGAAETTLMLLLTLTMVGCALVAGTSASQLKTGGVSVPTEVIHPSPTVTATHSLENQSGDGPGSAVGLDQEIIASGNRKLTLNWDGEDDQLQILEGGNILQTLTPDDVVFDEDYLFEGFLNSLSGPTIQDVNFDGAADLGILCGSTYNGPVCWFVWDQADERFRFAFYSSLAFEVDWDKRQLIDAWRDGNLGTEYYIYAYDDKNERIQAGYSYVAAGYEPQR